MPWGKADVNNTAEGPAHVTYEIPDGVPAWVRLMAENGGVYCMTWRWQADGLCVIYWCVCLCVCVCVCMCLCACMCVCVCTHIHPHTYICTHKHTQTHLWSCAWSCLIICLPAISTSTNCCAFLLTTCLHTCLLAHITLAYALSWLYFIFRTKEYRDSLSSCKLDFSTHGACGWLETRFSEKFVLWTGKFGGKRPCACMYYDVLTHFLVWNAALVPCGCAHAAHRIRPSFCKLYFCCLGHTANLKLVSKRTFFQGKESTLSLPIMLCLHSNWQKCDGYSKNY